MHLREKQTRDHGTGNGPHAADDHHGERKQNEIASHGREYGIDRREQHASEARQRHAECKRNRVNAVHRNAQRRCHVAVERCSADDRTPLGPIHNERDRDDDRTARYHQEQAVIRNEDAEHLDRATDRRFRLVRVRTEDQLDDFFKHKAEAEGQQQRGHVPVLRIEYALYQRAFDHITDREHR